MRIHLDPVSGIAGDMFIAACLDLGLDQEELSQALKTLKLPPWQLTITRRHRMGLAGIHARFQVPHEHHHRHLPDILAIIDDSGLPDRVKSDAQAIFTLLAEAEAYVHGLDIHAVHFHEVGAMDAILDICGAAYAVRRLEITDITSSPPPLGSGTVRCDHGLMPVPVPAVAELFRRHHVPIHPDIDPPSGELVTPTGAVILIHFCQRFGPSPLTRIDATGLGLGSRDLPNRINGLRLLAQKLSPTDLSLHQDRVVVLSTHIDDMNPEWYGPLWDHLFQAGALDVALSPITMKKGRPGVRLEVIAPDAISASLARLILTHTTSLGVRFQPCDRMILPRLTREFKTPWGTVSAKKSPNHWKLEYDDLARMATTMNWTLPDTQARVAAFLAKEGLPINETISS
ncbi:MAG: nickel pincer cofactor biosynthesis protein LarC [Magnetococcales bacterium]|nr:nickel pincer cofactor biosynthesis protein LarC [Magnetococcales bacterium]